MRRPLCWLPAAVVLGASGCASTAYRLSSGDAPRPQDAIVIGKIGYSGPGEPIYALRLSAVDGAGKKWRLEMDPELSADGRRSIPFFVRLPPGRYRVVDWEVDFAEAEWAQPDPGLEFEVGGGQIACVGAIYADLVLDTGPRTFGLQGIPAVKDECSALGALLRRRAPYASTPPVPALARPAPRTSGPS